MIHREGLWGEKYFSWKITLKREYNTEINLFRNTEINSILLYCTMSTLCRKLKLVNIMCNEAVGPCKGKTNSALLC